MRKFYSILSTFVLLLGTLLFFSCSDVAENEFEAKSKSNECTVKFAVTSVQNETRQAIPKNLEARELFYVLQYYAANSSEEKFSLGSAEKLLSYGDLIASELSLKEGEWTFTLVAYNGEKEALSATVTEKIAEGTNKISFNLEEVLSGTGSVNVTFKYYSNSVTSISATLKKFPSGEVVKTTDLNLTSSTEKIASVNYENDEVESGSYFLVFSVTRNEKIYKTPVFVIVAPQNESSSTETEKIVEDEFFAMRLTGTAEKILGNFTLETTKTGSYTITHETYGTVSKGTYRMTDEGFYYTETEYVSAPSLLSGKPTLMAVENPTEKFIAVSEDGYEFTLTGVNDVSITFKLLYVTGLTISPESANVDVGSSVTFTAALEYSDGTQKAVTELSAMGTDEEIAIVNTNSNGIITVTGLKAGEIKVTVTSENQSATCVVTVNSVSTTSGISVTFDETSVTDEGENITLEATTDEETGTVTLTATPKEGTTVESYNWLVDSRSDVGTSSSDGSSYTITSQNMDDNLPFQAGRHSVTVVATIDGERYSVSTTFVVKR